MPTRRPISAGTTTIALAKTVASGDLLYGSACLGSTLKRHSNLLATANIPALATSANYAALLAADYYWQYEGAVVRPLLREFVLDGNANLNFTREFNLGLPRLLDGIRLFATAPQILSVVVRDFAGYGIHLQSGDPTRFAGTVQSLDSSKALVAHSLISGTFTGLYSNSAEAFIHHNEITGFRDVGLHLTSVANQVDNNHVFGGDIGTQVGTPELGYFNHFSNHQTADSRICFLNYGPHTHCEGYLRIQNPSEVGLDSYATIYVDNFFLHAGGTTSAVRVNSGDKSAFGGNLFLSDSAIGYEFPSGSALDGIKLRGKIEDGAKAVLINNALHNSIFDKLQIYNNNLDIQALGQNNVWDVFGNGTITNNTGSALDSSNKIYLNGELQSL